MMPTRAILESSGFPQTETRPARERGVLELFEERVRISPAAPALLFEGESLTYAELDRRAHRLARHLRSVGAAPETVIGLCASRSPEMLVALLAVLKTGAAYLPLDPDYPEERLRFMVED
jgi:non-ribosomal peptide synthetase component F